MYYGKCFCCDGVDNCIPIGSGVWGTDVDQRDEDTLERVSSLTYNKVEGAPGLSWERGGGRK